MIFSKSNNDVEAPSLGHLIIHIIGNSRHYLHGCPFFYAKYSIPQPTLPHVSCFKTTGFDLRQRFSYS